MARKGWWPPRPGIFKRWSGRVPVAQEPPHRDELTDMVGRVVCDQQELAQECLTSAGRDLREWVTRLAIHQLPQLG